MLLLLVGVRLKLSENDFQGDCLGHKANGFKQSDLSHLSEVGFLPLDGSLSEAVVALASKRRVWNRLEVEISPRARVVLPPVPVPTQWVRIHQFTASRCPKITAILTW